MKRILFALLAAALCLSSCMETKNILYRGSMFATVKSVGVVHGDDGRNYYFTNFSNYEKDFPGEGRVLVVFDAISLRSGNDTDYDAELLSYFVPLCKEPVECKTPEEKAALGDDPVRMTDGNWGGGHLNMLCSAYLRMDSKVQHLINLEIVPGDNADTLHTVLRHNAGEDKVTDENSEFFSDYPFYASFPLADKIPEGKTIVLEIKWFWDNEWHVVYADIKK